MVALRQTYLTGKDIPKSLDWRLYGTHKELSEALGRLTSTSATSAIVGLAIHVDKKGSLEFVALAMGDRIFVFKPGAEKDANIGNFLRDTSQHIVGYDIAQLALYIKATMGYDVQGYNLPIKLHPKGNEFPGSAVRNLLDASAKSFDIDQLWDFHPEEIDLGTKKMEFLCLRAWISSRLASHDSWACLLSSTKAAETIRLSDRETACVFRMMKEQDLINAEKSRSLQNDFSAVERTKDGHFVIHNERYTSRVRKSERTKVVFENDNGKEHEGKAKGAMGKKTYVVQIGAKSMGTIKKVTVMGREELTNAEKARNNFLVQLLQGDTILRDPSYPFVAYLWFPEGRSINCKRINNAKARSGHGNRPLNQSQANVVEAMLNPNRPFVITHGPPGTGKTTTISVAMREVRSKGTAWVVAQSNVGVKNIAESLCKHGVDFKLLVSKEFYFEWHEHIYAEVKDHIIRTDELPVQTRDLEILFHGTRIVLSTLSTLSNPSLQEKNLFRLVPLKMLVVDEASQIGVLEYLHIFGRFKQLKKVCFFGDPKQLPPYGKDAASGLQSIFEIAHLKSSAYFLDTQYRMPVELGSFVSKAVYSSKLKSVHEVTGSNCVRFIDVWNGSEEKAGKSWKNMREVQTILHLVRHYYKGKEYTIITPYDAQRNAIQKALKQERLPWENVFNVDSFQGNEASYVLISVVRTTGPGFLKSQNRVNVMLTRCKAGMVLVTNRAFTRHDSVRKTLLGKLVEHWENKAGKSNAWCKWSEVAEKKVNLPGPARRK